jgi:putative transposase
VELRVLGHSVYRTEYHIVWIPKYRRRILNPGVRGYLHKLFPKVLKQIPGCEIVKMNMQVDHIHLLIIIPPKYAVSEVMGIIKGMTSSHLRKKFEWLGKVYWKDNIVWSPGYFVATVGIDEDKILKYVEWQGRQDSGQAKLEL